jgi:hypothetical protein
MLENNKLTDTSDQLLRTSKELIERSRKLMERSERLNESSRKRMGRVAALRGRSGGGDPLAGRLPPGPHLLSPRDCCGAGPSVLGESQRDAVWGNRIQLGIPGPVNENATPNQSAFASRLLACAMAP